jgi:hypothetical protein
MCARALMHLRRVKRTNLVKYKNDDLLADSHNILNRWKNYFCQLLNVHGVKNVRQTDIHTAESSVSEPSSFEAKTAVAKLKRHKSPATDQILVELIQAGNNPLHSEITHILVLFRIRKHYQRNGRNGDKTDCINIEKYHCYLLHTKFDSTFFCQGKLHKQTM